MIMLTLGLHVIKSFVSLNDSILSSSYTFLFVPEYRVFRYHIVYIKCIMLFYCVFCFLNDRSWINNHKIVFILLLPQPAPAVDITDIWIKYLNVLITLQDCSFLVYVPVSISQKSWQQSSFTLAMLFRQNYIIKI